MAHDGLSVLDSPWGSARPQGEAANPFEGLQGRSEPLGPGTYLVRAREGFWCAADVEVEVRSGETAEIELAFEPATERCIEVVYADGVTAGALHVLDLAEDDTPLVLTLR